MDHQINTNYPVWITPKYVVPHIEKKKKKNPKHFWKTWPIEDILVAVQGILFCFFSVLILHTCPYLFTQPQKKTHILIFLLKPPNNSQTVPKIIRPTNFFFN